MENLKNRIHSLLTEGKSTEKGTVNESGYHEKQPREQSKEEHDAWVDKKTANKKKYMAAKSKGDDDCDGAVDCYDYKKGKGNFKPVKMDESRMANLVGKIVKDVLEESKGKKNLENSFKSKEDMTSYRDQYAPNASDTIIDTDGDIYDVELTDDGLLGSGPYMDYRHHTFADGYDYCGDDDYNDYASEYNDKLNKRLATKGGQMSYEWERGTQDALNKPYIEAQHDQLEADADERYLHNLISDYIDDHRRTKWVNGKIDNDRLARMDPYDYRDFTPSMGNTAIRDNFVKDQYKLRSDTNVPKRYKLDRKQAKDYYDNMDK